MNFVWIWIWIFTLVLTANCVRIEENGYKDVTISFSEKTQEPFDIGKLKKILTKASEILYHATRRRSYFEEFTLVIPSKWRLATKECDQNVETSPKDIDIYVTDSSDVQELKTQHSKGCGQKGDVIYLPDQWLTNNAEDLAFQFVRQWSTYRYGVFSENPETSESCIATGASTWNPSGCYNIALDVKVRFDKISGLPKCDFPANFEELENLRSSIMFLANSSKAQDFCDGSDRFPHNPISPTLHNRICEGNSVWSVIRNTEDFQYGRNLPRKDAKPPKDPTFNCFRERKMHLALIVQDSDSEARNEIRYSLLHFLSIIESVDFSVTFATFSNDSLTKETEPEDLNLLEKDKIKSILDTHLKLKEKVSDICFVCGLRKAYGVSASSWYPMRVIILLAWESSLKNAKTSELVDVMESDAYNSTVHLLFLQDTAYDIVPPSLVEAVQNSGGRIFRVKNEAVFMLSELNVALLDASRNVLHVEDKIQVVHRKSYVNVKAGFTDAFLTPKQISGQLIYTMQCKKRGDITRSPSNSCSDKDERLQSPVCGMESNISADEDNEKLWQFPFHYDGGMEGTTCSSLALLKIGSSPKRPFTVKGWLSENEITPGRNALIIYAEIFGSSEENIQVAAKILGPGSEEFWLNLNDNGNGDPDITRGDNIYSRYFTSFREKGTYTVSINVKVLVANENKIYTEGNFEKSFKSINQTKVIGTFRVTQTPPAEDILPPNRVSDLRVVAVNNTNRMILIQWTAPGGDYDNGKALEYKLYYTDDWRNLQEALLYKIPSSTLNATQIIPKTCGYKEQEEFQLHDSSQPIIYYVALKAIDKSGNEGKLSNIVQVPIMYEEIPWGNETYKNETENITKIDGNLDQDVKSNKRYWYIIIGCVFGIIFLMIVINIIIWVLCFKKYKRNYKASRLKDVHESKHHRTGNDINSDESILQGEYEDGNKYQQSTELTQNQDFRSENTDRNNPLIIYAKIDKRSTNKKPACLTSCNTEIQKFQQTLNHKECDLGCV